ncbi:MAG TPA: peptidoglycan-associated lipoprotein Pal [Candidatus Binatia bacterium]|nr:peptidoglycan-associated lipoprotein Pal [Candidatus Binatia bacterium]
MLKRRLTLGWGLAISIALFGCQGGGMTNPEPSSKTAWTVENPNATKATDKSQARAALSTGDTSLDALREGRSPATPSSSPVKDIYFEFDRAHLTPDARETLNANAQWMKANPSARIEIEGHCDERGTNEYNLALGAKRAESARDYLITLGIGANRLSTISYGEEIPVCADKTEGCWQKNRRARFVIVSPRPTT